MIYALLLAWAVGLGFGGFVTHAFDKAEIQRLESAILEGNTKAEHELYAIQTEVDAAERQAANLNDQLEAARSQSVATANALSARVASAGRLYDRHQNCEGAVPERERAGQPETQTEPADFSGRLAEIVRRADETAIYAQTCWQFVTNNCGIKQGAGDGKPGH
jgi:hypothetical protein